MSCHTNRNPLYNNELASISTTMDDSYLTDITIAATNTSNCNTRVTAETLSK